MARTPITIAKTITMAMNRLYGTHLVINSSSFHGEKGKVVRMYSVKDAYNLGEKGYSNKELFCTSSGVCACLFMVDLLAAFQGRELEEHGDPIYSSLFARKNLQSSIDYMKGAYLDAESELTTSD